MKIGDRVFVRGYIDEIRKDTVIIRNAGGYFGTIPSEVITGALPPAQPDPNCSEIPNNSDTISRQAAIEALKEAFNPSITNFVKAKMAIDNLPPAQPEKRTENTQKTHACDSASRQAAIDALFALYEYQRSFDPTEAADLVRQGIFLAEKKIEKLPSAQPEIIRCKDCKHWFDIDDGRQKHRMCADIYGDWFCADAERRTDD